MSTLVDVARHAGVSIATVSHAINHTRFVRPEVLQRVKAAITELDYRPNALARGLRSRRTGTLGLVIPDIRNPFYTDLTRAAEDRAQALGYSLILCNSDENVQKESDYLSLLVSKCVDAILIAPVVANEHLLGEVKARPIVILDRPISGSCMPFVGSNNRQGATLATHHLLEHGHRKMGVVFSNTRHATVEQRLAGFEAAISRVPDAQTPCLASDAPTREGGAIAAQMLLRPDRPTAILSLNSMMTLGVLLALRELGLRCPEDVAVITFNNHDWAQVTDPPLTCVEREPARMAYVALDVVHAILRRGDFELPGPIPPRLVIRRSCGCPFPASSRTVSGASPHA